MKLVKLNLARNCLKYIIRAYGIKEIFIPYYTCPTVWISSKEEGCTIRFYHIDKDFRPVGNFSHNSFIVYTNYFGLCTEICNELSQLYTNLIIDNSQAFFAKPLGIASFYSLRKFFKVQSGAYLYTNKVLSENLPIDDINLNKPVYFHEDYETFVKNEILLNDQKVIKRMSTTVDKELLHYNYDKEKENRIMLYKYYEKIFKKDNIITLELSDGEVPYCYPFCTTKKNYKENLLNNNIILLRLWRNFPKSVPESILNETVALPVYDFDYAMKIINIFS